MSLFHIRVHPGLGYNTTELIQHLTKYKKDKVRKIILSYLSQINYCMVIFTYKTLQNQLKAKRKETKHEQLLLFFIVYYLLVFYCL